jgi:hypothetical protein
LVRREQRDYGAMLKDEISQNLSDDGCGAGKDWAPRSGLVGRGFTKRRGKSQLLPIGAVE